MKLPLHSVSWWWISSFVAALMIFALCLWLTGGVGFPLDDSWIHQDFARTLATTGQFAFQPGRSAAGETSPLWALLLTPPYLATGGHPPIWLIVGWSTFLGDLTLVALSLEAALAAQMITIEAGGSQQFVRLSSILASIAILTEWHLIWASASGMETTPFAMLVLLVLILTARGWSPWLIGVLTSLTIGFRPEGWLLAFVLLVVLAWAALKRKALLSWLRSWLIPFSLAFLPGALLYLLFNLRTGGSFLPTTFLAKSAEFVSSGNFLLNALVWIPQMMIIFLVSSPVLVILAFLGLFKRAFPKYRHYPSGLLSNLLWVWSGFLLLAFAGRVDPAYQHSRYLIPALPPLLILASVSAAPLFLSTQRLVGLFAFLALLLCSPLSIGRALIIYQSDVQVINCAEVETGLWLHAHLPPGAIVATHDVGAIGYFSGHQIIDITGLVDPELISLVHNPSGLEQYLQAHHVGYVAIYQDWFPPNSSLMRDLKDKAVYNACGTTYFQVYQTNW